MDTCLVHPQRKGCHHSLFLQILEPADIAVIFLCDTGSLVSDIIQLPLAVRRIHQKECYFKHLLISGLQFIQQILCFFPISGNIRRDDVHVISASYCLFLLLYLHFLDIGKDIFQAFNGCLRVYGLHMDVYDQVFLHIKEIRQHLIRQLR